MISQPLTSPSANSPTQSLSSEQRALLQEMVRRGLTLPTSQANWQNDPAGYLRTVLKADIWERQEEIAEAVRDHKRVAVRSCHHSGKTFGAAALAHWWLAAFDPSLVITTAPTLRQVKDLLWYEIAGHARRAGTGGKLATLSLEMSETRRALGFTTNEPERFQGWHSPNMLVIVDEASGVGEEIYQAIEGILTGPNTRLLLIGNPNFPAGTFFEAFRSPLYQKFHISAFDVPERLLPAAWREERLTEWGEESPAYQVRVLGNFPSQGEDSLINLKWVEEAMEREAEDAGPCEMGVDVARYGADESVAYVRRGARIVDCDVWRGHDTMASAGRVAVLARKHAPELIKVDDIGVGGGVVDRLAEEGFPVVGVNVGLPATDSETYSNLRTEIFQGLADRFKAGDISLPKDDTLLDQLTQLRFTFTPRGQKKLTPKEEMRKTRPSSSAWQSPDRADALALAFFGGSGYTGGAVVGAPRDAGWPRWGQ